MILELHHHVEDFIREGLHAIFGAHGQLEPRAEELAALAIEKLKKRGEREERDLRETLERHHLEILLRGERLPEMKVEGDEVGTFRADPRGKRDTKGEPSGGTIPDPEPMPS